MVERGAAEETKQFVAAMLKVGFIADTKELAMSQQYIELLSEAARARLQDVR